MAHGERAVDRDSISRVRNLLYRITRFNVLLTRNDCCISLESIQDVTKYLEDLDLGSGESQRVVALPHRHNLDLLYKSIDGMKSVDNLMSETESLTSY